MDPSKIVRRSPAECDRYWPKNTWSDGSMAKDNLPAEREIFRIHYEDDSSSWGKQSGSGSSPFYTIDYRCFIDKFVRLNRINSIVDIGCGDWQFSRFLNLQGVNYLGIDVVPSVIAKNKELYRDKNVDFCLAPDEVSLIPGGDLLIMKDVLQHFPNAEIIKYSTLVFPKFKHCLITNSYEKLQSLVNTDISFGEFRCLDLSSPPFSFRGSYVLEFSSPLWERIRTFSYYNS